MPSDSTSFNQLTRRQLVTAAGPVLVTIAALPSCATETVAEQDANRGVLNRRERASLAAFGDTLLPGAKEAGIVRYVEQQLRSETPLLFLRYLDYADDCVAFYKGGLKALDAQSVSRFGVIFAELSQQQQGDLVTSLSQTSPPDWDGPPSPLFYFVIRNDATEFSTGPKRVFADSTCPIWR